MSLARRISTVGGFTLLSRVFGFVRDMLIARYLGAGMASDAFFIAFKLPNFFRRLFGEGAFTVGFVPLYARFLGKDVTPESKRAADAFASQVLSWLTPILILFLIIMEVAMVPVMFGLSGGFEGDTGKFNFAVELGRYTFPYLVLISLMTFFAGMLNAVDRFSAAAFAPVILNIFMISALLFLGETTVEKARWLAIAVSASGGGQLLWVFVAARRAGLKVRLPMPKLSPEIRELFRVIGPAALGAGIMQINLLIDTLLAARFLPEGSVSWLFYADRLNQLPLGVIGIAVGTVLLPGISRLLAGGDDAGAARQQNRAIELTLLITLPAATALALIASPIIATLFEREAFTSADTAATAGALAVYALGLPAYVIAKALTPGYFARQDTKTPVRFATVSLVINTGLNFALIWDFAHVGLAAATAIAAWANVAMLYYGLKRRDAFSLTRRTWLAIGKSAVACGVMAAVLMAYLGYFGSMFEADGNLRIVHLVLLIIAGGVSYLVFAFALGAVRLGEIRQIMRR
ncbi:murein biosynthesis integral membrane protein MurJ [Kordiimonas aestuarii]|uniref:murein biosynthesis integral membrane protein MurJ n=1 Tax=Kordiimonas aestuarii TaxID=1005925 RepID=UPI0021CF4B33|nr:murein biosynthesis integral membrane protein MurJ [Kordiimonas aestuarii]